MATWCSSRAIRELDWRIMPKGGQGPGTVNEGPFRLELSKYDGCKFVEREGKAPPPTPPRIECCISLMPKVSPRKFLKGDYYFGGLKWPPGYPAYFEGVSLYGSPNCVKLNCFSSSLIALLP